MVQSFIHDEAQDEEKVKKRKEEFVEANEFVRKEFKGKSLNQRFKLTKENWFRVTLDLKHFKHILSLLVFYKLLFLFLTR